MTKIVSSFDDTEFATRASYKLQRIPKKPFPAKTPDLIKNPIQINLQSFDMAPPCQLQGIN